MNLIQKIQLVQREVYNAHARMVEVESRDRGWSASDASEAESGFKDAVNSYRSAFGMEPEFGDFSGLMSCGNYPLFNATTKRIMEICAAESEE